MSKVIFVAAAAVTGWGIFKNVIQDMSIGGTGGMAMNTYYILGTALFVAAAAAHVIWPTKQ